MALAMRETLISVAIEKFGQKGFDGVGTREIAAAAGTNMSSIQYHFGGKEGLFEAAAAHIFSRVNEMIGQEAGALPLADASREEQLEAVVSFLVNAARMMLGQESASFGPFISRVQMQPTEHGMMVMRRSMQSFMEGYLAQIRLLKPELEEQEVRATAFLLFGLTTSLTHSRAALRILLERDELGEADGELMLQRIAAIVRAALSGGEA